MCERGLLPAPFSPSSACTSPAPASKSTPSFATTPGNRFVMPRSATAAPSGAAVADPCAVVRAVPLPIPSRRNGSALGPAFDALAEPVHRVQVLHGQLLALRDAQ